MKVETTETKFSPVIITLETQEEAEVMVLWSLGGGGPIRRKYGECSPMFDLQVSMWREINEVIKD